MAIEYRDPKNEKELEDVYRCLALSYDGSEHLSTINQFDPYFQRDNIRACFADGQAISVAQVFERPMRIGNCVVRMGGIGGVSTDPPTRAWAFFSGVTGLR